MDHQLGKLIKKLKSMDLYDDTMIILTSDHGEEFWEHGRFTHDQALYEESVHIPMIIKPAQGLNSDKLKSNDKLFGSVDLLPTMIDLLGLKVNDRVRHQFAGKSILRNYHKDKDGFYPFVFFDHAIKESRHYELRGIRTNEWKYIVTYVDKDKRDLPLVELYNINNDPGERKNLIEQRPDIALKLNVLLNKQLSNMDVNSFTLRQSEPDNLIREKLKALGYVN